MKKGKQIKLVLFSGAVAIAAVLFSAMSLGFLNPLPEGTSYTGGKVSKQGVGQGATFCFDNNCLVSIWDVFVTAYPSDGDDPLGNNAVNFNEVFITDDDNPGEPSTVTSKWKKSNIAGNTNTIKLHTQSKTDSSASCPPGDGISLGITTNQTMGKVEFWFTSKSGNSIVGKEVITDEEAESKEGTAHIVPESEYMPSDSWAICFENRSKYMITGFVFSDDESPELTMIDLLSSMAGSTDAATKTVDFDFPLNTSETAIIEAKYSYHACAGTEISYEPIVSGVVPGSMNPRFTFGTGTDISVPDITLEEVLSGIIHQADGNDEIILEPREAYDFTSLTSAEVTEGNILLGAAYVSEGKIHIPISAASYAEGKSTITVKGIKIDTLPRLARGFISVRIMEPAGNDSNFHLACHDPDA